MRNETGNEPFKLLGSGIETANAASLPETGMLFACVIGGQCDFFVRNQSVRYSKGICFMRELNGRVHLEGSGKLAYIVAGGVLCEQICTVYGIEDGFSASAAGASEELFRICELAQDVTANLPEIAFSFHRLVKISVDARIKEEKGKVDTAILIKEYIDSHASGKLTLEEISKVFFISKTQIFRIFKMYFGIPPMQYFLFKKVEISKKMLTEDNMRVSDIAETLGFSDSKHFSKTFRKYTGVLPREFRKENRTAIINKSVIGEQ